MSYRDGKYHLCVDILPWFLQEIYPEVDVYYRDLSGPVEIFVSTTMFAIAKQYVLYTSGIGGRIRHSNRNTDTLFLEFHMDNKAVPMYITWEQSLDGYPEGTVTTIENQTLLIEFDEFVRNRWDSYQKFMLTKFHKQVSELDTMVEIKSEDCEWDIL